MKYKDIRFYNNNCGVSRSLIKYNENFKDQLNHLKDINEIFASYIEKWPSYMDDDSKMQSYLIMENDYKCYGGLFLYPSTADSQELVINYLMDKDTYNDLYNYYIFKSIIESLGVSFYKYSKFSINLYNGIELDDYDNSNYKKMYSILTHSSYEYNNFSNNKKYSHLINSIKNTAINLKDKNVSYSIYYNLPDNTLHRDNAIRLDDLSFGLSYFEIRKDNYESAIFKNNGDISINSTRPDNHIYHLLYNVLSNDIECQIFTTCDKTIDVNKCESYSDIKVHTKDYDIRIFNPNNQNYKIMTYKSAKINNSSNIVNMYVDDDNNILKLYVDYNIHKNAHDYNKSKIKGIYTLRIDNRYGTKEMKYISRSGWFDRYSFDSLKDYKQSLYDQVTSGILTIESADELINIASYYFNQSNKDKINLSNKNMCQTMFDIYDYVLKTLNSINLDNPVSGLKDTIDEFISCENNNKNGYKKVYEKDHNK